MGISLSWEYFWTPFGAHLLSIREVSSIGNESARRFFTQFSADVLSQCFLVRYSAAPDVSWDPNIIIIRFQYAEGGAGGFRFEVYDSGSLVVSRMKTLPRACRRSHPISSFHYVRDRAARGLI